MLFTQVLKSVFRFERSKFRALTATRCTLAIAIPLLVGDLSGHLPLGVMAALGAIYAGLSSFRGVYKDRLVHMAAVTFLMAFVTFLGSVVGSHPLAAIISVALVSFTLSLVAVARPGATLLSVLATGTLIILAGLPMRSTGALGNALLVMSGGLSQIVLLVIFWPFTRHYPERKAVADVYSSLADFLDELQSGTAGLMPDSRVFQEAREVIDGIGKYRMDEEHYVLRHAMQCAESVRAGLVGLGLDKCSIDDTLAATFTGAMRLVSEEALHGRIQGIRLALPPQNSNLDCDEARCVELVRSSLAGLMEPYSAADQEQDLPPAKSLLSRVSYRLTALKASVTLRSIAFRHSLRYSMALGGAVALSHYVDLRNSYWIPLTVCMVLRQDYASTIKTGASRTVGTLAAVILATGLAALLHPTLPMLIVLLLVSCWGLFACYQASYAAFTMAVSLYVIFSTAASGLSEWTIGEQRLMATCMGVAYAFAAYLIWPTWQASRVKEVLSEAAKAQIEFAQRVLMDNDGGDWEALLHGARSLRYEAESVVQAASLEPKWGWEPINESAKEVLAQLEANAALMLSLHAQWLNHQPVSLEDRLQCLYTARNLVDSLAA